MPTITVEGPPLKALDKKRALAKAITTAAAKAYEFPGEKIVVLFKENPPENVSVGGELLVDRRRA